MVNLFIRRYFMKKILTIIASLILISGVSFAGDFYNGDIQFQLGAGLNTTEIQDMEDNLNAKEVVFGIQTWHLFNPVDILGVGFMAGFNFGFGPTEQIEMYTPYGKKKGNQTGASVTYNFELGPAIGIYLGNVVRFGANICYSYGYNYDMPFNYKDKDADFYISSSVHSEFDGISTGVQAKFLPNKKCNPIIGWKFLRGFSNTVGSEVSSSVSAFESSEEFSYEYTFTQNIIYAGVGISW